MSKEGRVLLQGELTNGVYVLQNYFLEAQAVQNKPLHDNCQHLIHRRLGHVSYKVINKTLALLGGHEVANCNNFLDYQLCKQVKAKAYPKSKTSSRVTTRPLDLVHMDVMSKCQLVYLGKSLDWFSWTIFLDSVGFSL